MFIQGINSQWRCFPHKRFHGKLMRHEIIHPFFMTHKSNSIFISWPINVFHGSIIELSWYVSIRWCFIVNSWSMKVVQFNSWAMKHRNISVKSIFAFWERKFCCIVMLSAHPKSPGNKSRQIIFSVDWAQPKALKLKQMILPTNLKTLLKRFRKTSRNFCVSIVPF